MSYTCDEDLCNNCAKYKCLLEEVVAEAKNVRKLISVDDHWCIEDCHKCKARESFDLALNRLENYKKG